MGQFKKKETNFISTYNSEINIFYYTRLGLMYYECAQLSIVDLNELTH